MTIYSVLFNDGELEAVEFSTFDQAFDYATLMVNAGYRIEIEIGEVASMFSHDNHPGEWLLRFGAGGRKMIVIPLDYPER